ncbi:MAG: flagellar hook-length control protein FliK [Desulfovibrio sp.]|jgi:flagellar hook-length control protein FliK|nr:flagellar hook-length control protein FliK [Desulfovibrio sp.]
MQFLPTDIPSFFTTRDKASAGREASPQALDALAGGHEGAAAEFQRLFHEALAAVDGGEEVSATAALSDAAGPLARGPYSRHTTDGVTYSLDEVCFTKKELLELRRELLKAGAPEQALKQFDALAGQPDGATLAQVMASLQQMTTPRQLDGKDKDNIVELLGKIDPTGSLAQEAVNLMEEGRGQAALTLISRTFAAVESGGVEMRKDQLLSLGRGLGFDPATLRRIAGTMGDYAAGLFSSAQFNALTAPAQEQFAAENARQSKVNSALEATLKPVIARARARMEKEKAASSLQERKVEQSKTHIEKTVLQNSRRRLDIILQEGQSGHADALPAEAAHSEAVGQKGAANRSDAVSGNEADKAAPRGRGDKSAAAAPAADRAGMPLPGNDGKNAPADLPGRDIVSARLYRDAPRQSGAPAPQAAPPTPPTQLWLADRLLAQDLRSAADETARPEPRFEKGPALRNDARPATRIAKTPETAATRQTDAPARAADAARSADAGTAAGNGSETRAAVSRPVAKAVEKADDAAAGQIGAARAAAAQPAAANAEKPESAAAQHVNAGSLTAARPVNATYFVEAGSGGQPAGDNSSGRRRNGETSATAPHIAVTQAPLFETPRTLKDNPPAASEHAARQVEESLYSALRGGIAGTTRLDLQLHPQELGAISIALTLHNGEVRARIRPEKGETADLLSGQAEAIRASLEQQGVKVDKIEVRLHDPSNNDGEGGWRQNPDRRDARQEKDSPRDELTRLRTLANIRNSFMNSENEILEQPVHYHGQTARHADRILHLVA